MVKDKKKKKGVLNVSVKTPGGVSKTSFTDPSVKSLGGVTKGDAKGSKAAKGVSKVLKKIPLIGGVYKGAERLAFESLKGASSLTGNKKFSEEEFEGARSTLDLRSGNVLKDPGVQSFIAAGVGGVVLGRIGAIAPRMAKFVKPSGAASITRTGFKHELVSSFHGGTRFVGRGAVTTQRAFKVSNPMAAGLAKQLAKMDAPTLKNVVSRGVGLAWRNKKIIGAATGAQMLMTWFAADNILTTASIYSRDTASAVRFGQVTLGEAAEGLEDSQKAVNTAKRFIKTSVTVNPIMWPFAKLLLTGSEATQRQIDFQKQTLGLT